VLKHRDEVKIGDVIECEKGLALYIGQGTSSEDNPHVHDLKYKRTDPSQIESVRLSCPIF